MASDNEASCVSDPNFAIICAFFEKFGKICGVPCLAIQQLQDMIENSNEVHPILIDLHVKLIRKTRKTVHLEQWERGLVKFCNSYSHQDAWEVEHYGYKKTNLTLRLRILKNLVEKQFDANSKVRLYLSRISALELRSQPIGRDVRGNAYWCYMDENCDLRVYKECLDEETWELVAKDREGLVSLITLLSSGAPDESSDQLTNDDSNSVATSNSAELKDKILEQIELPVGAVELKSSPCTIHDFSCNGIETQNSGFEENVTDTILEDNPIAEICKSSDVYNITLLNAVDTKPELISEIKSETNDSDAPAKLNEVLNKGSQQKEVLEICDQSSKLENTPVDIPVGAKRKCEDLETNTNIVSACHKKSKSTDDCSNIVSETIEEAVIRVKGEGSGRECEGPCLIMDKEEYGEVVEESVLFFYGTGSGADCDAGNPDRDTKQKEESKDSSDNDRNESENLLQAKESQNSIITETEIKCENSTALMEETSSSSNQTDASFINIKPVTNEKNESKISVDSKTHISDSVFELNQSQKSLEVTSADCTSKLEEICIIKAPNKVEQYQPEFPNSKNDTVFDLNQVSVSSKNNLLNENSIEKQSDTSSLAIDESKSIPELGIAEPEDDPSLRVKPVV